VSGSAAAAGGAWQALRDPFPATQDRAERVEGIQASEVDTINQHVVPQNLPRPVRRRRSGARERSARTKG